MIMLHHKIRNLTDIVSNNKDVKDTREMMRKYRKATNPKFEAIRKKYKSKFERERMNKGLRDSLEKVCREFADSRVTFSKKTYSELELGEENKRLKRALLKIHKCFTTMNKASEIKESSLFKKAVVILEAGEIIIT